MFNIDLKGKKAFIAGIGDDQGYGWAIAKMLYSAGAKILIGTWVPIFNIFKKSWEAGKFDQSRKLLSGKLFNYEKLYPMDASFDTLKDIPPEILENKRYKEFSNYSIEELSKEIEKDFGKIDIIVHSLANAPEVKNKLLDTSRNGYLSAISSSAYSFISLIKYFGPILGNGSALALTYTASTKAVPGYGGGMSSAKAALESDIRTLAWEAGRKWNIKINCISAGPLKSRAAKAIGMIDYMIEYSKKNAPLKKDLQAEEIAKSSLFLLSDLSSAITGQTIFVDNGLNIMGLAMDSKSLEDYPS
ncbi:MAG: enoyl-ACP reductase [Chlamydiae bacterium SM23_39]|nr:MAG: enoyl-ACP reductase [Chlamydiae bacterium SM23_39]